MLSCVLHWVVGVFQNEMRSKSLKPWRSQPPSPSSLLPLHAAGTAGTEPNQADRSPCSLRLSECSSHMQAQFGCLASACIIVESAQPVAPSTGTTVATGTFLEPRMLAWNCQLPDATTPSLVKSSICTKASCQYLPTSSQATKSCPASRALPLGGG